MKILISGYYGFHNIGDEAILKSIVLALKQEDPNIEITVLSNNVEYTENTYNVKAINRWNILKILKVINITDGLISGGGSLFQDVTSSRSIWYYSLIIILAKFAKKPVFVYAQGVGPINRYINKKIVKMVFNNVDYITLRDDESKELIKSIGVYKSIDVVPDPVMGYKLDTNIKDCNVIHYDTYITVSIREWKNSKDNFFKDIAKACDILVQNNINIVFIPMHGKHDEDASIYISKIMKHKSIVLSKDLSMEEKMRYIKGSKLMIGMRLHALIFSANVGTPMIGISYDPKIDSYLKLFNQVSICNVSEQFSPNNLANKAMEIIKNYKKEKKNIEDRAYNMKESAKITSKKAIKTIGNKK